MFLLYTFYYEKKNNYIKIFCLYSVCLSFCLSLLVLSLHLYPIHNFPLSLLNKMVKKTDCKPNWMSYINKMKDVTKKIKSNQFGYAPALIFFPFYSPVYIYVAFFPLCIWLCYVGNYFISAYLFRYQQHESKSTSPQETFLCELIPNSFSVMWFLICIWCV